MRIPKVNIPKKYKKIAAWAGGALFVLLLITGTIAFAKREALLKKVIAKAITKAKNSYGLNVNIGKAGFTGLSTVHLEQISVVPENRDTLAAVDDLSVGVKLFPLLFGNVKLSEINLRNGLVNMVFRDSVSNLDFILKRKKKDSTSTQKTELSALANNLLNQFLYKIPDNMELKNFTVQLNDNDTARLKFLTTGAMIRDGDLTSTILVNDTAATWHVNGLLKPGRKKLDLMLFADKKRVELAYLNHKLKGKLSFDTVRTTMSNAEFEGDDFKISGAWAVKNILLNQSRIAGNDIIVPDARVEAEMFVGDDYIGIDSTSTIFLKKATVHPYIKYTLRPHKIYEMKLRAEEQDAQSLLNAFPIGLFESLEGLQVSGKLKYDLDFYLDSQQPDSVQFNSALTPTNFKLVKWGKTNLQKINAPFVYVPYEFGKPMRSITVGPVNGSFTPLEQISPNFKNALLTSEDPSFFSHNGFVEESIRKSIAVNFKEKKFKRGGSTISMQLVKNVFLSRQKTLARKAEEILIVWLLEHEHLVSKQRMLEVYFNIIEMGYNVYGIGEAARHYFGKSPADLSLGEGIFLASIVPRPKASMYKFSSDGSLKPYMLNYFNFIGGVMARRGYTQQDSTGYGFYDVRLREGLRQFLPSDSAIVDTTALDDDPEMDLPIMQDASKNLFDKLFPAGKGKDTIIKQPAKTDTPKTRKQLRIERRAQRKNGNGDPEPF